MKFSIPVSPISINKAYRGGRRFKTKDYELFEKHVGMTARQSKEKNIGELFVKYTFHVKNYSRADVGNMEKCLSDVLSKLGYFENDNDIKGFLLIKEKALAEEYIEIEILPYIK